MFRPFQRASWPVIAALLYALAAPLSSSGASDDIYRAPGYDYSWLTQGRYQSELASRIRDIADADGTVRRAHDALVGARVALDQAMRDVSQAWQRYLAAYMSGDHGRVRTAWGEVGRALQKYSDARDAVRWRARALGKAEEDRTYSWFWKAQLENDWREAQAARSVAGAYSVAQDIARCRPGGGRACSANGLLRTDTRFTVFQPVLSMVGVHHAHAMGLTGAGVRVAIEDDAINYKLPEFSGRVSFEGARIVYPRPLSTTAPFGANEWNYESASYDPWETEDPYIHESLTADAVVLLNGDWAEEIWLENQHENVRDEHRWVVIPAVESEDGPSHGTRVASVAVGRDFGVAPGATLIPIFKDFSPSGQSQENTWSRYLLDFISRASDSSREFWDEHLALSVKADYENYDVVNRSFGIGVFDGQALQSVLEDGTNWWGDELRRLLPLTWRAYMQTDVHPDDRAVIVYATGNSLQEWGGLGADLPFHEHHLRGHHLSVMALDKDGAHAFYTNFCGSLPADWNADQWGRHYCLAAPGTVNAASNRPGWAFQDTEGTSFAAPIVTGAIALLMERFRGQLGNSEIAKRIVNTANNEGRYAQMEIYGAGLLDLEAALRPVGEMTTGTPSISGHTAMTVLYAPPAMGSLGKRLAATGAEVASLDSLGAPFWTAPGHHVRTLDVFNPIPGFSAPEQGPQDQLYLGFTPGTMATPESTGEIRFLVGDSRVGLEKAPGDGLRWGILADAASWQGGHASGAFGDDVRSVTTWIGRGARMALNDTWSFNALATLAFGRTFLESGAMLEVDPHVMSAWNVALERGQRGHGTWSRLALAQPLRAETGNATLRYLSGLRNGVPVYDRATASLEPDGREVELALTHETELGWGRGIIEVAHAWDAGHEPGRTRFSIGAAYRLTW